MALTYLLEPQAILPGQSYWLRPVNLIRWSDPARNSAHFRLAGGWMGFSHLDLITEDGTDYCASRLSVHEWLSLMGDKTEAEARLHKLTAPRADFAGLSMAEPHVMGIVNVTPDSFSDGGQHYQAQDAIAGAIAMQEAGATILDVGGESTRPGAEIVGAEAEIGRISPVIEALTRAGHIVSADTRHTQVMGAALRAGAPIINDVGGFRDSGAPEMVAEAYHLDAQSGFAIAMHMQGTPETMQANPHYQFAPLDVYCWLEERIQVLLDAGLPLSHIAIDPGFGFGKTPAHNIELIQWTSLFHGLGVPLLIGVSRKSTIAKLSRDEPATERLGGSLALTLQAVHGGAQLVRTHDVAETKQALTLYLA